MKFHHVLLIAVIVTTACVPLAAQPKPELPASAPPSGMGPVYWLDQFGSVATAKDADATLEKAAAEITAAGGGVIVIPAHALATWRPKNNTQEPWRKPPPPAPAISWGQGKGVTIVDGRTGTVKITPPQLTGLEFNRVLNLPQGQSLPFWGYYPLVGMRNTVLNGSCSYRDYLQEDVKAGKDRRFYVATIRGIFPGAFVTIQGSEGVPRLYVKSLGYDKEKKMWYFTADVQMDVFKGEVMGNKNHVNIVRMDTVSHNENQTFDLMLWRHNYSQGDNYLIDARFKYMSDIHSTGGDENGVIFAAFIESLTNIFRAEVEKWSPDTGQLQYKNSDGKTLGTGRPVINLNPAKWITRGTVNIVRPATWIADSTNMDNPAFRGKTYPTTISRSKHLQMGGLIRLSADAPVTDEAMGRYFAVEEKDEYVPQTTVRRWYLIDRVTANPDGTKDLRIIRHWWGAKSAGSPTLYKPENYSWDGHERALHYIIAPGANVYDVSEGVENPKRTIKLVPTPFAGTAADFAPGDAVEQAIGPDPFKPVPFRSWMWDKVPGVFPSPVFDVANVGPVQRDAVLTVHGFCADVEKDKATRYDRNPPWDKCIDILATCNTGIQFGADTANAAILFTQPAAVQPIKWHYYGAEGNPRPKVASLTVSRETGELNFTGNGARFDGPITATGLSADLKPSRNLRGKNVAVPPGQTSVTIAFPVAEADGDYAVFVEQNWLGNRAIANKDARGFTVRFEKPVPEGAKVDWMIVR